MGKLLNIAGGLSAAFLLFAQSAVAQEQPEIAADSAVLRMTMSDFDVRVPVPGWTEGLDGSALEHTRPTLNEVRPGITSLMLHRVDENAILWTELMGVLAVGVPGYTAGQQFKNLADPLGQNCKTDALELFWIAPLPGADREALVGLCGEYSLNTRRSQPCIAGVVVSVAIEKPEGVVSAYHEWCTQSFDVNDDAKWPVTREELQKRARQLQVFTDFDPVKSAQPDS